MLKKTATLEDGVAEVEFHLEPPLSFEGVFRPGTLVQFYGPLRDPVSMANVGAQLCRRLIREVGAVSVHNYVQGGWFDSCLEQHAGLHPGARVGLFFGVPIDVPEQFFRHPIRIGGFVCETDLIEETWVEICNRFDLIFVPSAWCRDAFLRSGVEVPVLVVPHGLDVEYKPYADKTRSTPFVFYDTFYASSYCSRKSLEELVRAFLTAFEGRDDVVLRLRTDGRRKLAELREKYDFGSLIWIDAPDKSDTESFARIYSQVHCTVHPAKGEGFGLVPFQSIACETPVIAPHATGMADYLSDDNSIRLRTAGRVRGEGVGNAVGTYFAIVEDDLVRCLRYALDNWEHEYRKVREAAPAFRRRYRWDVVLADLIEMVNRLLEAESARDKQRILRECVDAPGWDGGGIGRGEARGARHPLPGPGGAGA